MLMQKMRGCCDVNGVLAKISGKQGLETLGEETAHFIEKIFSM